MRTVKSESPHGHFKRRLYQALLLRGSFNQRSGACEPEGSLRAEGTIGSVCPECIPARSPDFDSVANYQLFIEEAIASLNQQHQDKFEVESLYLAAKLDQETSIASLALKATQRFCLLF